MPLGSILPRSLTPQQTTTYHLALGLKRSPAHLFLDGGTQVCGRVVLGD